MSYNDKLAQTGKKAASARRKYYGSFDYGSGIEAKLRGGTFSFGKKFSGGSYKGPLNQGSYYDWRTNPYEENWLSENFGEDWVYEPDTDADIREYWNAHPREYMLTRGIASSVLEDWERQQTNGGQKFSDSIYDRPEDTDDKDTDFGKGWWKLAGIGIDAASNFLDMNDKRKAIQNKYDAFGATTFNGLTDNSALLSTMANTPMLSNSTAKDYRDKSVGQDILSVLGTGVSTTMNSGGNYLLGLTSMGAKTAQILGERWNADRLAQDASLEAKRKNQQFLRDMSMASQDVDARNDWRRMLGYYNTPYDYAFGGLLHSHGGDYNGGLTYIDEGGRHEENPYEGVPSGFDEDGNPNLVEEGEVIWNNEYVFSDRLKVPEELAKKYKLGGKKDYTFAEAIEKVTKENRVSPTDAITIATTKEIVNEFMEAQEALRQQEQIAAREELEAAQAQDFLAQLEAAQGGGYPIGAPVNMGNAGMGMPNEAPVTEGEMMPPGYAFGGNKFEGGGYKVVKVGNRYFITTDGAPKITGKMYGNRLVLDDQFKDLPSFESREEADREAERMRREAMPALEYNANINASGVTAYTGDKITKRNTGEVDTHLNPIYEYVVTDPNSGKKYIYHSYEDAAKKYSSIPRKVNDPRVKGGYAYVTPYGDIHLSEKASKDALRARLYPQSASAKTTKSSTNRGIGTTAAAAEMPANFNAQLDAALGVQDTLSVPALQQPSTTSSAPQVQAVQTAVTSTSGTQSSGSNTSKTISSGTTGRMTTPSGNTINYRRDINGKEWEAAEPYQNFLSYMRGKGADDKEVKEWMDYIQNAIKESGSKYKLKGFDDWSYLAEDGKVGPVHQATLKAAEYFAKRRGLTAVDPTGKLNPTIGEALGVKPETAHGVSENSTPQSPQTPSGSTAAQEPRFNYRDTYLRYAPAIGSSMAALYGMLNRPDYSNADRVIDAAYRMGTPVNIPVETIGDYRRRNPYDERYLVNMANQNRLAAARGIANTAGGNRAMDLLGNMSLAHNNQQELGEIMRQAYLANRQDDAQVAEFNRGTNVYNMNALNQRNLSQAQLNSHRQQASLSGLAQGYGMRQAIKNNWDEATMQSLNSTLASLGAIGKENEEYNMLMSMAEEGYFDHAYLDNGRIRFVPKITSAKGGKLNRKKRRF